jgi:hypothetical protein
MGQVVWIDDIALDTDTEIPKQGKETNNERAGWRDTRGQVRMEGAESRRGFAADQVSAELGRTVDTQGS